MRQFHTKMLTQVGPLKVIHIIEFAQDDEEDADDFRKLVQMSTPDGAYAQIGFRSASVTMFHNPTSEELEKYNKESRKPTPTQSNKQSYDEVDETIATRKKRR